MSDKLRIDKFKGALAGGGSRANLFEVVINKPAMLSGGALNSTAANGDLNMLVKAAVLPASDINPIPVPFRGRTLQVPGDRTFQPWTLTIINDTDFKIRDFFEDWMNQLSDHVDGTGVGGDWDNFAVNMQVHQLNRQGNRIKSYTIHDCWPSQLSEIGVDYGQENTIQEFSATLQMTYWTAQASAEGSKIATTSQSNKTAVN